MGADGPQGGVAWDLLTHAYGPAVDVPGWIAGLRDPGRGAECLHELYGSITHQGTRYSATPYCVPQLVEAAEDRAVMDRAGVIFLIQFCAIGYSGDYLDWRRQRDRQAGPHERASWDAVVAGHERLRGLLADADREVAGAALTVLAWTGDASDTVFAAIRAGVESGDERDQCNGWLSSVVLGQLPPGLAAPASLTGPGQVGRFGAAVAAVRFGGSSAPPEAVDELCSVFATIESGRELKACDFLRPEVPERVAASALATVPVHLRGYTSARLLAGIALGSVSGPEPLTAYLRLNLGESRAPVHADALPDQAREALIKLLDPLESWRRFPRMDHRIYELEEHGLPGTLDLLTHWLEAT